MIAQTLVKIIVDEGVDAREALIISEDIIISIEGALIFTRATRDYSSFNRTLEKILNSSTEITLR